METNEQLRKELKKALEEELEQVEERVVKSSQAMGRKLMGGVLNSRLHTSRPTARRQGSCGHVQRLVGESAKELITLVGPVSGCRVRILSVCMLAKRKWRSMPVRMEKHLLMCCGHARAADDPRGATVHQLPECA